MVDEPKGDPQGQSPPQTTGVPAATGTGQTPPATSWDKDPRFKGDPTKVYESYKNLEAQIGKQGNELGEARKKLDEFTAFYNQEFVNDGGKVKHKSVYEAEQASKNKGAQTGLPEDVSKLRERLSEMSVMEPDEYFKVMVSAATQAVRTAQIQREKAYENPVLAKNPDIRQRAVELETQYSPDDAVKLALAEKVMAIMQNGGELPNANANPSIPSTVVSSIHNQDRWNFQPSGRISQTPPVKSKLTQGQIDAGAKFGFTAEQLEPHAEK